MVSVPGVHHAERFTLVARGFALQAVVFNVVHDFKQHECNNGLRDKKRYYFYSFIRR